MIILKNILISQFVNNDGESQNHRMDITFPESQNWNTPLKSNKNYYNQFKGKGLYTDNIY